MLDRLTTINRERLSVFIALILISLGLLPLIESPTSGIGGSFFGTPLKLEFSATTLVALLAAALSCAGIDTLLRAHPKVRRGEVARTLPYWIIPALTVVVASQILTSITEPITWVTVLLITGALLWLECVAEYATIDAEGPAAGRARMFLNAVAYILAALLFGLIWNSRARSLLSASLILLVTLGLAIDLLLSSRANGRRIFMLSAAVAIVMAEANWATNYWDTTVFIAAPAQLFIFYALVGLAGQYLIDRLNRRVLIEFAIVMLVALIVLLRGRG
ncbi:MAG TPA: hypothetical protein VFF70_00760 [Anaerolineae bacterium]|nr:hypothetical protein [Anaerolineae bacterium]